MTSTRVTRGAAVALLLAGPAAWAADGSPLIATSIKGEVIRHAASVQSAVTDRGTIDPGDVVETHAGAGVQLDFLGAIDVTLGPGAALMYHSSEGQQLRVKLGAGDLEARVAVDADLRFNVGPLRARAVGARVAARVRADGATVCVLQGSVSVQSPAGEKRLDQPGQCLERTGSEELVRGPSSPGAHPLPPVPIAPMVGATALPPPPPAALSSPPPSEPGPAVTPPGGTAAVSPPAAPVASPSAPAVASAPSPAAPAILEHAPRVTSTVAIQARPVTEAASPAVPAPSAAPAPTAGSPSAPPPGAPTAAIATTAPTPSIPAAVVVTPFADAPSIARVAVNPQRIPEAAPPTVSSSISEKVAATPLAPVPAPSTPPAPTVPSSPPVTTPPASPAGAGTAVRTPDPAVEIPALAAGWTVVIAALNSPSGAAEEAQRLRARGLPADIFVFVKDGQKMYRLGLGRFRSYEAAAEYAGRMRKELPEVQPWIAAFGAAPS